MCNIDFYFRYLFSLVRRFPAGLAYPARSCFRPTDADGTLTGRSEKSDLSLVVVLAVLVNISRGSLDFPAGAGSAARLHANPHPPSSASGSSSVVTQLNLGWHPACCRSSRSQESQEFIKISAVQVPNLTMYRYYVQSRLIIDLPREFGEANL